MPRSARLLAVATALALALSACGGSDDTDIDTEETSPTLSLERPTVTTNAEDDSIDYPLTVKHAQGETTIAEEPQRVVVLGQVERDAAIALDVSVVGAGVPYYDDSLSPWLDGLVEADELATVAWDQSGEYDLEDVLALKPDLIVAPTSFTIAAQYDQLSRIAPTIGAVENPLTDRWQDVTELVGEALGKPATARDLVREAESAVTRVAEAYPTLSGKTLGFAVAQGPDTLGVLVDPQDTMLKMAAELGLEVPSAISELPTSDANPGVATLSLENVTVLGTDLLFVVSPSDEVTSTIEQNPLFAQLPAVEGGTAQTLDLVEGGALRSPTALSLHWALNAISPTLAQAAS